MGKKIAIIATDFLEQFIKDMITELDMGFSITSLHMKNSKILRIFIKKSDRNMMGF